MKELIKKTIPFLKVFGLNFDSNNLDLLSKELENNKELSITNKGDGWGTVTYDGKILFTEAFLKDTILNCEVKDLSYKYNLEINKDNIIDGKVDFNNGYLENNTIIKANEQKISFNIIPALNTFSVDDLTNKKFIYRNKNSVLYINNGVINNVMIDEDKIIYVKKSPDNEHAIYGCDQRDNLKTKYELINDYMNYICSGYFDFIDDQKKLLNRFIPNLYSRAIKNMYKDKDEEELYNMFLINKGRRKQKKLKK